MSWFGSSTSALQLELDNKISEATSETIPNGELDLSISLEITDFIRSKKLPAQQCMRSLKKRLNLVYSNPNLIKSTLKLIDLCIKNCGFHFLVEISSREFIDYLVDFIFKIHYNSKDHLDEAKREVSQLILKLIKSWELAFQNQLQLNYVEKKYQELLNEGFKFPEIDNVVDSKYVDSEVPPDWIDSDSCMICYTPFSMLNRKHHCRACGGVYCQNHSSNNIQLVNLGIMEPVRVCDNCYAKNKHKSSKHTGGNKDNSVGGGGNDDDEDEQIKKAIELSLQDNGISIKPPTEAPPVISHQPQEEAEEEDDDMKAAIAASLKEYEATKPRLQHEQLPQNPFEEEEEDSDLYNIDFTSSNYQQPQQSQPQFYSQPSYQAPQQQQQQQQLQQQQQYPPKPPPQQDLSQSEEEQINLFITLMNNVRNDSKKQQNIMYDQNLSELYSQILKLKPKVNKSLRESIEKYNQFLEMNNKLSTITRLYDQFWEKKLNYGINSMSIIQQNTGYPQFNNQNQFDQQQQQQQRQQLQSRGSYSQQQQPQQHTGQYNQQQPQHTGQYNQPSEPQFDEPEQYPQQQQQQQQHQQPQQYPPQQQQPQYSPQQQQFSPQQQYNQPSEPQFDQPSELKTENKTQHNQSIYPTTENLPESESDNEKQQQQQQNEYVEVSLPNYPPPEDISNELPTQSFLRHATSSLSPNAYEDASTKYPILQNVEEEFQRQNKNINELPTLPNNLSHFNEEQQHQQQKQKVYEPEPLIDL
ncbi:VPS27 [Candida jiufengensis]|uniref:VPS27 n=1 Tax=Candida jiufengensis TaxID=497108 RepID=UPI0022258E61|nr:VPS27 [Candida jiufengensis]KAI5955620.1 VPS27 [Candida jiufengensis]